MEGTEISGIPVADDRPVVIFELVDVVLEQSRHQT